MDWSSDVCSPISVAFDHLDVQAHHGDASAEKRRLLPEAAAGEKKEAHQIHD